MTIKELAGIIEDFAPLGLQEGYDNSGLIVGHPDREVLSALLCVDVTEDTINEAAALGADIIISHHPIIFDPIKKIIGSNHVQRVIEKAIRKDIALYACHTNLDAVWGGMSFKAGELLGLSDMKLLSEGDSAGAGFGVVGVLDTPVPAVDFLHSLKDIFAIPVVRHSSLCHDKISKVALCTGSGGSLIEAAKQSGAEIYVTADLRYNHFFDADDKIIIADIGHYESEFCVIDLLYDVISKKIPTFVLHKSVCSKNPINYLV